MLKRIRRGAALLRAEWLLLAVLLMASCDGTVYHGFKAVDSSGWSRTDTLIFEYGGEERHGRGKLLEMGVQVRYNQAYKYRDMCFRIETLRSGDSILLSADTLCCHIYGDDGRHLGNTSGALYQNMSDVMRLDASAADTLHLRLTHIMADSCIAGVCDVGIKLNAVEK